MGFEGLLSKVKNWKSLRSKLDKLSTKGKGDCFELLTKYLLKLHPKYATKLKNVWLLIDVPVKVKKELNLPGRDEGIDIVAQTFDGGYWAVQCKYVSDDNKTLTRRELSTFTDLTFGICRHFELGLICTTADRFSHKLKLHGDKLSFCAGEVWRRLDEEFFVSLHRAITGKQHKIKSKKPRPHQKHAISSAKKHFIKSGENRGKMILPCASGKSLAAYWIAKELRARSVLIAVPSLALVRQSLEVWARESLANELPVDWICVCSDESVGNFDRQDISVLIQDLGVRVDTDPREIANWLRNKSKSTKVVITTYQSGKVLSKAAKLAKKSFDLGIMDEAHRTVGPKDSLFSHLLLDKNIKISRRIFMTATERRYAGRNDRILSMSDPEYYGDTFELLSFKEAIEQKPAILSDYQIVTILVTKEEIAKIVRKNALVRPNKGSWDKDVEAEMLAAAVALRKAMQSMPIKHAVSYHTSISRAIAFKDTQELLSRIFPKYGKLETYHVSGRTPTSVRSRYLEEFSKSPRALITNARCLTEGVDVPNIDCVIFADPKRSTIDIVQAVGRALRPAKGKKKGYIILPVIADDKLEIFESSFSQILMVLRALAANDERIVEYFRSISQGKKPSGRFPIVSIDVPTGFVIDGEEFSDSISLRIWPKLAKLSWRSFKEAKEYVQSLNLRNAEEWRKYCSGTLRNQSKKPADIPSAPYQVYSDSGWYDWNDWLGSGTIATHKRAYMTFRKARAFVRGLGLRSRKDWFDYCREYSKGKETKPDNIPANPWQVYSREGWKSLGDWLGTGVVATTQRKYRSYKKAREFVRRLGLKTGTEWKLYCFGKLKGKKPKPTDIPANPYQVYFNKGWIGIGDWLGTDTISAQKRKYRSFTRARSFVRKLGLNSQQEWKNYCKGEMPEKGEKPHDIPASAYQYYKDKGWKGFGDWLGTGRPMKKHKKRGKGKFRSFSSARSFARSLKLQCQREWTQFCKGEMPDKGVKPKDIPVNPYYAYIGKGWKGWGDWLGTGAVATGKRRFRSFHAARRYARSLGLKSKIEWMKYSKGELLDKGKRPDDIPGAPNLKYLDNGWSSWPDWLGTD